MVTVSQLFEIFSYFSRKELDLLQTVNRTVGLFIKQRFENCAPFRFVKYVYLDSLGDCYINGRNDIVYGWKVCIYGPISITVPPSGVLTQGWKGIPYVTSRNLDVHGHDLCCSGKFYKLHNLLKSKHLRVKETNISLLQPTSRSSHQFTSKICQLSYLWKGQRLRVTMHYPDLPAELLQSFAKAQMLIIQLNLDSPVIYTSKNEWCNEWHVNKVEDSSRQLLHGISPFDYSQLQQCPQLIVLLNETTRVNTEDIVNYLNSNP
uniref:F-box domain-containing protein n=1 Tax=Ditylenchus dipsaci TaxID=166011 RepID=A0A915DT15_9BILA